MPDTNATSQAADTQPVVDVQVTPPAAASSESDDDFDKERALATIRKQREFEKEARARLKRLDELEAKERERQEAELSEVDKLNRKVAALELEKQNMQAAYNRDRIKAAIESAAKDASLYNPQDAFALIDQAQVTIGEDGQVTGADAAIKKLVEARPYLVKQQGSGVAAIPASPRPDDRTRSRADEDAARNEQTSFLRRHV